MLARNPLPQLTHTRGSAPACAAARDQVAISSMRAGNSCSGMSLAPWTCPSIHSVRRRAST